ncbi:MAG: hypothetical protein ABGZ53_07060 [Fuerstiella sp.]
MIRQPATMSCSVLILVFARPGGATDDGELPKDSAFRQLHTFNEPDFP